MATPPVVAGPASPEVSSRDREFEFEFELEKKASDERLKKVVGVGGTFAAPGPGPALPDLFMAGEPRGRVRGVGTPLKI